MEATPPIGSPAYLLWANSHDLLFFNCLGVLVCLYALYVEMRKEADHKYRALCDFNEHMSCSRVLTSEYSRGFGIMGSLLGENSVLNARNCNAGLCVYVFNIIMYLALPQWLSAPILFYISVINVLGCVYLAIILFFVLKDLCVVCMSIYAINGCLLFLAYHRYQFVKAYV